MSMGKVDGRKQEGGTHAEDRDQDALERRCPVHGDVYDIATITACQAPQRLHKPKIT